MSALVESWIVTGNDPDGDFPLNNLPYGVFSRKDERPRCCTIVGETIIDLAALEELGYFDLPQPGVFSQPSLNAFMALGSPAQTHVRDRLTDLLRVDNSLKLKDLPAHQKRVLFDVYSVRLHMPFAVSGFTDFYASKHHATNVGTMFRGAENALPPNWLHMPIGYNGRASTVVVSDTPVTRPKGQLKAQDADAPHFGASRRLDFELEMGAVVGASTAMGDSVSVAQAGDMIFGYVLLNDWSARDIQAWEYQPLGPFQGKAFATSIAPWVITRAALAPFRVAAPPRDVPLLPYLQESGPMGYDIELSVELKPRDSQVGTIICRSNTKHLCYSAAQQLAHHASSGCAMRVGDLLGSGTISGPERGAWGSLLELAWGGKEPITLDDGSKRTFLEDGDMLTLRGFAQGEGYRIGFGSCSGTVVPARE